MRRWRHLPARRGQYWRGAESSPAPPKYPPPVIRQAGSLRFAARLLPSRRRRWDPGWGQGNQGQAWPSYIRQAEAVPSRGLRPSRGRRTEPPWPQANQGAAWPSYIRQAGSQRNPGRLLPPSRRTWGPPVPQRVQSCPSYVRPAGSRRPPSVRRGRLCEPPWAAPPAPPQFVRPAVRQRHPGRLLPAKRRRWEQPFPQVVPGQQGTAAVSSILAATAAVSDVLAGNVTLSDALAGTVTLSDALAGTVTISDAPAGTVTIVNDL